MRLRVPRRSHCHFLFDGGCAIHPAKPTQCRIFPFWPELVESHEGVGEDGEILSGNR